MSAASEATPPWRLTARQAAERLRAGAITAEALAQSCLARAAAREPVLQAWSHLDGDRVLEAARALDRAPRRGPLHGLPVGIKDVIDTADMPTEHGSPLFAGHRPALDAAAVTTLRAAGALVFGKTHTTEFAAAGRDAPTGNPHDPSRTSGGSSSGSAAAVADGHVPLALGTQTGGSMIRPGSFCGTHAFKPTWGAVSREGAKVYATSLDTIGWYARSAEDLDLLAAVYGLPGDPAPVAGCAGLRIAVCRSPEWPAAEEATRDALAEGAGRLRAAGASVTDLDLPERFGGLSAAHRRVLFGEGRAAFLSLARQYGTALHDDFRHRVENRDGYTPGELAAAYDLAAVCRTAFDRIAADFDAVLTPSAPGEAPVGRGPGNPVLNQIWTLLHVPVVNLPGFRGPSGLPVGLSLTGPRFSDRRLLAVAAGVAAAFPAVPEPA